MCQVGHDLMRQVGHNDAKLVELSVWYGEKGYHDDSGDVIPLHHLGNDDCVKLGALIGRNTSLTEVTVGSMADDMGLDFIGFVEGLSSNRSIVKVTLSGCDEFIGKILPRIIPFFQSNRNLESLVMRNAVGCESYFTALASFLWKFRSLKEFVLHNCCIDESGVIFFGEMPSWSIYSGLREYHGIPYDCSTREVGNVLNALVGHSGLRSIHLEGVSTGLRIGLNGCQALATMLRRSESKLDVLHLANAKFGDEGATILAHALTSNYTLKHLSISDTSEHEDEDDVITEIGWQVIFSALNRAVCRSRLEELYLQSNNVAVLSLSDALRTLRDLKVLDLSYNPGIPTTCWQAIFQPLRTPGCFLESLLLNDVGLDTDAVIVLANALINNDRLRVLELQYNSDVSASGWTAFSTVLQNPNSPLERIDLYMDQEDNTINDDTMISLSNALANNKTLMMLRLGWTENISDTGYAAMTRILCNSSSILDTYLSNHTLEDCCPPCQDHLFPTYLSELLKINREYNENCAARLKIIKTHFGGIDIDMRPFTEMDLNILPTAISWMARDDNCPSRSLLYQFARTVMPSLLAMNSTGKKRKFHPTASVRRL